MSGNSPVKQPAIAERDRPQDRPNPTLDELFRENFGRIYRAVGRLMGYGASTADIEDVTQQVFLAAHRALPSFRGDSSPSTWLYGIACRVVLTSLRSRGRHRRLLAAFEEDKPAPRDEEAVLECRNQLRAAWAALMRLKPKKRVVYILHELEGMDSQAIAAALGIPERTVWTRLHYARQELREHLEALSSRTGKPR